MQSAVSPSWRRGWTLRDGRTRLCRPRTLTSGAWSRSAASLGLSLVLHRAARWQWSSEKLLKHQFFKEGEECQVCLSPLSQDLEGQLEEASAQSQRLETSECSLNKELQVSVI